VNEKKNPHIMRKRKKTIKTKKEIEGEESMNDYKNDDNPKKKKNKGMKKTFEEGN
jgi:hypothetical protein